MARIPKKRLRIAIIGGGVSGNVCAYLLHKNHDITVFTADKHNGGHTHTHSIEFENRQLEVDTGFMVYNQRTYPLFVKLLDELGIESQKSDMSFSVRSEQSNLEYSGSSFNGLFAQRSNLVCPAFYKMLRDLMRFNREAPLALESCDDRLTLETYLRENHYGDYFIQNYLVPLGASIWSARADRFLAFPLNSIRVACPIDRVGRFSDRVQLQTKAGEALEYDQVIFATHADTTLRLLTDPTKAETEILQQFEYQQNDAVLHTDQSWLPKRRRAWASWNYHVSNHPETPASVTYDVNRLQKLGCSKPLCVTLNPTRPIADHYVLESAKYRHPVFSAGTLGTQKRHHEISGKNRSFFCGAYWGFGFHEDGVRSGLAVAQLFGKAL